MNAREQRIERWFEWPLIAAAVLVIPTIALEQSDGGWGDAARNLNWLIWSTFAAEFVAMLAVTDDRWRYLRQHPLDVAIVFLTPPFLPASLQSARAFRLFRLLRLVKTAVVLRRVLSAEGVRDAAVVAMVVVLGGGAAFAEVERAQGLSAWDGVWWAMTTVTTVGYGDLSPTTDEGRVIAMTVMLVGIGFVALLTAAAADRFIRREAEEHDVKAELAELRAQLTEIETLLRERR